MKRRDPLARITKSGNSWRVRLAGYGSANFSPSKYGGEDEALRAAQAWRDARWDGRDRPGCAVRKVTPEQAAEIRRSGEHYKDVAERYGISPNYVHQIRRGGK